MTPSVDIVVPVFNEAQTVTELFDRLRAACPNAHVVFVDNGSTDGTLEVLSALPGVQVIRHAENLGYGHSLRDGIAATRGDYIVMIDADLEYLPEDVPAVVAALGGAEAVYGSRFRGRRFADGGMPLSRRLGNALVTALFNVLFRQNLTDLYTGLRGVRRSAWPAGRMERPGFEIVLELAARLAKTGGRIHEVPVGYEPRTRGQSKMQHLPEFVKFARCLVDFAREPAG